MFLSYLYTSNHSKHCLTYDINLLYLINMNKWMNDSRGRFAFPVNLFKTYLRMTKGKTLWVLGRISCFPPRKSGFHIQIRLTFKIASSIIFCTSKMLSKYLLIGSETLSTWLHIVLAPSPCPRPSSLLLTHLQSWNHSVVTQILDSSQQVCLLKELYSSILFSKDLELRKDFSRARKQDAETRER